MIVNELVTNAVKYGRREDQQARVRVVFKRQDGDKWLLSVEDDGPGIPPDAEKSQSIGMRLIRSLATQLGGALEVASSPAGSRFSINGAMARVGAGSPS
jgi:two-component sensor histidine kinase